jgi:TolA-binding protein
MQDALQQLQQAVGPAVQQAVGQLQQQLQMQQLQMQQQMQQQMLQIQQQMQQQLQIQQQMQAETQALQRSLDFNHTRRAQNARQLGADGPLRALCKTEQGHPNVAPQAAPLTALAPPVPVGINSQPPDLTFFPAAGITRAAIMALTAAQLSDIEWFYNQFFEGERVECCSDIFLLALIATETPIHSIHTHHAAGATVPERRNSFLAFLIGG